MKTINRLLSFITIICFSISLGYSQQGSFKIGNIKYDYNNLEFSFSENPGDVTFKIGKFSLSTSNTIITIPEVGKLSNFRLVNLLMILVKPGLCPTIIVLLYLLFILRIQSKIRLDEEWYKFSENIFDLIFIESKK